MVARSQTAAASLAGNSLASTSNAKRRLVVCRAILLASYAFPIIILIFLLASQTFSIITAAASLASNSLASNNSYANMCLVVCCAILIALHAFPIIIPISPVGFPDAEPLPSLFAEVLLGSISPKLFMCMPPASKM